MVINPTYKSEHTFWQTLDVEWDWVNGASYYKIEYSTDNGQNYETLVDNFVPLTEWPDPALYVWNLEPYMNIMEPSYKCVLKITSDTGVEQRSDRFTVAQWSLERLLTTHKQYINPYYGANLTIIGFASKHKCPEFVALSVENKEEALKIANPEDSLFQAWMQAYRQFGGTITLVRAGATEDLYNVDPTTRKLTPKLNTKERLDYIYERMEDAYEAMSHIYADIICPVDIALGSMNVYVQKNDGGQMVNGFPDFYSQFATFLYDYNLYNNPCIGIMPATDRDIDRKYNIGNLVLTDKEDYELEFPDTNEDWVPIAAVYGFEDFLSTGVIDFVEFDYEITRNIAAGIAGLLTTLPFEVPVLNKTLRGIRPIELPSEEDIAKINGLGIITVRETIRNGIALAGDSILHYNDVIKKYTRLSHARSSCLWSSRVKEESDSLFGESNSAISSLIEGIDNIVEELTPDIFENITWQLFDDGRVDARTYYVASRLKPVDAIHEIETFVNVGV